LVGKTAWDVAPSRAGETLSGFADVINLVTSTVKDLQKQVDKLIKNNDSSNKKKNQ
jgi:hypothetical protein